MGLGERAMSSRKEWSEAKRAHMRADYVIESQLYQKMADAGDARAQASLGVMYDKGRGVVQDFGQALKWFRRAADAGEARGVCSVGSMYDRGRGVPQDYAEAMKWYVRAA